MDTQDKNTLIAIIGASIFTFGLWWIFSEILPVSMYWWIYLGFWLMIIGLTVSELNKVALLKKQLEADRKAHEHR